MFRTSNKYLRKGSLRELADSVAAELDFETINSEKVNLFINLISSIRSTRAELNVLKSKVKISYTSVSSDLEEIIKKNKK